MGRLGRAKRAEKAQKPPHAPKQPQTPKPRERLGVWRPTRGYEFLGPKGSRDFDDVQDSAATTIRDDFENSCLAMGNRDSDPGHVGGGETALVGNEEAWKRYREAMACLSPVEAGMVRTYVIDDLRRLNPVKDAHTIKRLGDALEKLARFYGYRRRSEGRISGFGGVAGSSE